jgi:hypothetical protein
MDSNNDRISDACVLILTESMTCTSIPFSSIKKVFLDAKRNRLTPYLFPTSLFESERKLN